MELPILYKRTKTGAIQYYKAWVDTRPDAFPPIIVKESGQLNTSNPQIYREAILEGKQKRTAVQQAEFQAQSDWKSKLDSGYKSLEQLGIKWSIQLGVPGTTYTWFNSELGMYQETNMLNSILELALPKFNNDAAGNCKPMLATDWNKIKKIEYPVLIQPKLDGVRCLMVVQFPSPFVPHISMLSRSGKEYTSLDHIKTAIIYACEYGLILSSSMEHSFILDGEIYSDDLNFQGIVSAVKAFKPDSLKLKFRAYDVVTDSRQIDRWFETVALVKAIGSELIQHVITHKIHQPDEVKLYHDQWVQEGYEGAMIRLLNGVYAQGQRSRDLLKVKEFDETEFVLKGWEIGQRPEDLIGVCSSKDGLEFRAKMQGTKAQKEELQAEFKYPGLSSFLLTVKHFGWTEDKLPRFPVGKGIRLF